VNEPYQDVVITFPRHLKPYSSSFIHESVKYFG